MFLLHALLIVTVIYWFSALLAELLFTAPEEQQLPSGVRVGLGYVFSLCWFAAGFKFMPITWVWGLGAVLLALYVAGNPSIYQGKTFSQIRSSVKKYLKTFVWYLVAANLFFLPLHISRNYGPFTEGGGDVSAYADVSKYLTDNGLPAYGINDAVYDIKNFLSRFPKVGRGLDNLENLQKFDEKEGSPPTAHYAAYRVASKQIQSSAQFSPFAQWFFLAGKVNYPIFYASLAFQYACMLLTFWHIFKKFSRAPAFVATLILSCSHGLVSAFYNLYYIQTTALMILVLIISIIPTIRLVSWQGIRTYWIAAALVGGPYSHYLMIIIPFLFIAIKKWDNDPITMQDSVCTADTTKNIFKAARILAIGILACTVLFWLVSDSISFFCTILSITKDLFYYPADSTALLPWGQSVQIFSEKWFGLLFGAVSQQHYPPLMNSIPLLDKAVRISGAVGILALAAGLLAWVILGAKKTYLAVLSLPLLSCFVAAITISVHLVISQQSVYTQAKAAQNVLPALYMVMVLPFAVLNKAELDGMLLKSLKTVIGICLIVFAGTLLIPRIICSSRLAYGHDRSGILEPSFYQEAEKIMLRDKKPFVWFEPRKSADLYVSIQPFAGGKMVPTRHLILDKISKPADWDGAHNFYDMVVERQIASDFLAQSDLDHLWLLTSRKVSRKESNIVSPYHEYEWEAKKIINRDTPLVLFSGHDYEKFFAKKPRTTEPGDEGWFSYLRNGSAMLYLPPGGPYFVEVIMYPVDVKKYAGMLKEVNDRLSSGSFSRNVEINTDGRFIYLGFRLDKSNVPGLAPIARYSGECWLNVRLDGKEIKD